MSIKRYKLLLLGFMLVFTLFLAACSEENEGATENGNDVVGNESADNDDKDISYPESEVKLIVPAGAGGTLDLAPRAMSAAFKEITGQSLVIENQAGGAHVPGTMSMVNAEADGYTLAIVPSGLLSLRPALQPVEFEYPEDFTPILGIGDFQLVFATNADVPYDNMQDMIDDFNDRGEPIRISTSGVNTYSHIMGVMVANETGVEVRHIPYEDNNEAVTAVLGGNADLAIVNLSNVSAQVESEQIKVLGVPAAERYSNFDQAPTLEEQGIEVVGGPTFAIYGPANLPEEIQTKLSNIFLEILESDEFKKFVENTNLLVTKTNPEEVIEGVINDYENVVKIKEYLDEEGE